MEGNDKKIEILFDKIINLLQANEAEDWALVFRKALAKFITQSDKKIITNAVLNLYNGGMGSFRDLVLHKNDKVLIKENDELASLKHALFNVCLNYQ